MKSAAETTLKLVATVIVLFNYLRYVTIWAPSETVAFLSGDIRLSGTLIKPSDRGFIRPSSFCTARVPRNPPECRIGSRPILLFETD